MKILQSVPVLPPPAHRAIVPIKPPCCDSCSRPFGHLEARYHLAGGSCLCKPCRDLYGTYGRRDRHAHLIT